MKRLLLALLSMMLFNFPSRAQDDDLDTLPNLTLTAVQSVGEFATSTHSTTLSPDGRLLAYIGQDIGICIYNFAEADSTCSPYPETHENGDEVRLPNTPPFYWSPDSRFIALTEDSVRRLDDGDIWIYDVEAGEYLDITDDGYAGNLISDDAGETPVDALPVWSPDGSLYFFRYIRNEDDVLTALMRIPAEGGSFGGIVGDSPRTLSEEDPTLLADYTDLAPFFAFYDSSNGFSLSGTAEISPDGTQLAAFMRPQNLEDAALWIVDLSDGSITQEIPTSTISEIGLPDWVQNQGYMPEGLTWINESELVVNFINPQYITGISWTAYHINLETDEITPIFDFGSVPSLAEYFTGTETEDGFVGYPMPRYGAVTPDGDYFLYVTNPNSFDGAALEALPITGGERLILNRFEGEFDLLPTLFTSIGTDGETVRALLSGYIFTFEITE